MKAKTVKTLLFTLLLAIPESGLAQFNTIRKKEPSGYEILKEKYHRQQPPIIQTVDTIIEKQIRIDTLDIEKEAINPVSFKKEAVRKKHLENNTRIDTPVIETTELPELTISNLLTEIRKNGIKHEKIVLAQAILETGWFRSSVCRNKNNLFGLTNPRTGQYYEFRHWTESVRAYYTKVQYRYKEGNYLMWLDKIGYAEDPRYVSSLIKILRQYML